jgi:excisionase family DNA binding protein
MRGYAMSEVIAHTIDGAVKASGLGRTKIYELIGAKKLEARKSGKRTLIMADSLRSYLASLPVADIRTASHKQAA